MIKEPIAITRNFEGTGDFEGDQYLFFYDPLETLTGYDTQSVENILKKVEEYADSGKWAVGFVSYEASPAFDSALMAFEDPEFPKICFSIFDKVQKSDLSEITGDFHAGPWKHSMDFRNYGHSLNNLKQQIMYGNSYQANFTFQLKSRFEGSALAFFKALVNNQKTPYSTYFSFDRYAICSASPELFFERSEDLIICKPMKGTAVRADESQTDLDNAEALKASEKEQAENIMVVDLIRNDLSRIAEDASVKTTSVFNLEAIETVWQMTSTVSAKSSCSNLEVWKALFPCASITGAPKARTMQILKTAEKHPRRVYTGGIAVYSPLKPKHIRCSVAIRTALIDKDQVYYGVGSGITFMSNPRSEYDECLLKARVLPDCDFQILESILFETDSGYALLDQHLQRMLNTSEFFGFECDLEKAKEELTELSKNLNGRQKIRLLLNKYGEFKAEALSIPDRLPTLKLKLASEAADTSGIFVKYKTTNRKIYEKHKQSDCDDTLLFNHKNEVCETCIGNFAYKLEGNWYTPPVECGILEGIYRRKLLDEGKLRERIITLDELKLVSEMAVINSVRGWMQADFCCAGE